MAKNNDNKKEEKIEIEGNVVEEVEEPESEFCFETVAFIAIVIILSPEIQPFKLTISPDVICCVILEPAAGSRRETERG